MNFKKITAAAVAAIAAMAAVTLTSFAAGTKVPLTEKYFPDKKFREVMAQVDADGNGYLSQKERDDVTSIELGWCDIKSLKGIEYFKNLEKLECIWLDLTELDLSKNTELTYLNCHINNLTELDLSKNTKLEKLLYF